MTRPPRPFHVPPEVQAREARLAAVLAAMAAGAPDREPARLGAFRRALSEGRWAEAVSLVEPLASEGWAEDAFAALREARRGASDPAALEPVARVLVPLADAARTRRTAGWQLDPHRTSVRFCYEKRSSVLGFDTGDLHRIFQAAFRLEGFLLALDLGHHPRPLLQLGPPLPASVAGSAEWGEAVFRRSPGSPEAVLAALANRLPGGLRLHRWEEQPVYATPITERADSADWRWTCPPDWRAEARVRTQRFLDAERFPWDRPGKVEGQKQGKQVDLRPLISALGWEGDVLRFTTPLQAFGATNPLKALGAILARDPDSLQGLVRESVRLREDPRLAQGERFEPKLRNLYEDAVLLTGGSNITIIDEDDDEPLRLG